MPAIGRCTSYGPLNTSRITIAADMTTIMIAATTIEATITVMVMVMDTTAIGTMIDTTTVSETLFASAV
jgi:hypothetical protein